MTNQDNDERLASILDGLTEQVANGGTPDIDQAVEENPDLAVEIRELWATMALADDLATVSQLFEDLPAVAPAPPPTQVPAPFANFIPIEEIGRGGMGVVYRATQRDLGRTVALKMILRGPLASEADVARFRAEAESAAQLNHPNIVPVHSVGEYNGQPYFSMQYIEGDTLAARLSEGPLPSHEAARILLPICRAIADANRNGVLHRDLKPSNILIDKTGRPFVTDFGLAKRIESAGNEIDSPEKANAVESLTQSGAIIGTPSYMAPEQAMGQRGEVGAFTDVYSLGAILYATITGRPPFQSASPLDTLMMVLDQDPIPPHILNPRANSDLEIIALKCLQKPADLRYTDADKLADDLEAFLNNEPISARSSQFSQIISRAFRETHHASVLENWGLLWMWHSLVVLVLCLVTNFLQLSVHADGEPARWPYLLLWTVGLGIWAVIFYNLRRRAGPVTFVERQIVHVWAGSMIVSTLLFFIEWVMDLEVLALSPVIGLVSGMVFLVKASLLNGKFYFQAAAMFLTGVAMSVISQSDVPDVSISVYGIVAGLAFFIPGMKYHRQRIKAQVRRTE
jgi:serine/threonine-protein kinase